MYMYMHLEAVDTSLDVLLAFAIEYTRLGELHTFFRAPMQMRCWENSTTCLLRSLAIWAHTRWLYSAVCRADIEQNTTFSSVRWYKEQEIVASLTIAYLNVLYTYKRQKAWDEHHKWMYMYVGMLDIHVHVLLHMCTEQCTCTCTYSLHKHEPLGGRYWLMTSCVLLRKNAEMSLLNCTGVKDYTTRK